jgi:hypothetical protein
MRLSSFCYVMWLACSRRLDDEYGLIVYHMAMIAIHSSEQHFWKVDLVGSCNLERG